MKDFKLGNQPIAVVGMASLMPDAKDLTRYWDNIAEKLVSIVDVPADRWSIDDYYDPDPFAKDKSYCKRGAFIPDIDFNPIEYGLPPNILEVTDVSQLLALVIAKDVLADSGILSEEDYDHDRIGITLGIGGGQKLSAALGARLQYPVIDKVLENAGVAESERSIVIDKYKKAFVSWEENSFPGLLGNVIAGRIANRFNFGGMNSVVDAACASSLSAMKMAVNELVLGHSDLMITGGSCTDNSIFMYMSFSKTPAFTNTDFIQPFDIDSKGMMVGEGIGMIALKRLEDAERDGDRIYALIKGIGSSSDGKFKSIYAPRSEGQAKALNRAYDQAGFLPKTVSLVEAHGTGTAAGDVAEFNALSRVFGENNDKKQHIALGSVKSQIGHLKAAAGAAGFMKCALALHHKVLPPTASLNQPNPKLEVEDSPFYLNAQTRPWLPSEEGHPRRAAVSAFGFGGTNFHFVLEEYQKEMTGAVRIKHLDQVSLISAVSNEALIEQLKAFKANLDNIETATDSLHLYQKFLDETSLTEIKKDSVRLAFISKDTNTALTMLDLALTTLKAKGEDSAWELPQGLSYRSKGLAIKGKVAALFSGQGSQYLHMGDALAQNYPEFREGFTLLDGLFNKDSLPRLSDTVYPIATFNDEDHKAQLARLQLTQNAQPSIGAFSVGAFNLFKQAGFQADFVAGHSFGELTALWAAGVYSEQDFYMLAKARGLAMSPPDDKDFDVGTMMAVSSNDKKGATITELEKFIENYSDIKIANFNSKNQVVIAGASLALKNIKAPLKEQGFKLTPLPVSAAFHTELVAHAQAPFAKIIEAVKFSKPRIPVYANNTGKAYPESAAKIKSTLKQHILNSVQFKTQIENMYVDGARIFIEFGPKNVLTQLTTNILDDKDDAISLSVNASSSKSADSQLKLLAAKLVVLGVSLHNIDPYAAPKKQYNTQKTSPLNIKISAAAYVSDKTKQAYTDALNDGFRLSASNNKSDNTLQNSVQDSSVSSVQTVATGQKNSLATNNIELDDFYALQRETLRVHEKYLENPKQYVESFQSLLSQVTQMLKDNPEVVLPKSIEQNLLMFNEQQSDTIKLHEKFLEQQAEASQASLNVMAEHYSFLTGGPQHHLSAKSASVKNVSTQITNLASDELSNNQPNQTVRTDIKDALQATHIESVTQVSFDIERLKTEMLAIVAEKTGYPSNMLELDMDMEADLGIDSIKRVEILGSVQESYPDLPELDPEALSELRTLQQIVDYIEELNAKRGGNNTSPSVSSVSNETDISNEAAIVGFDIEHLKTEMLAIVAEKTGYPSDMLELDMDMEADLGIDSIKRVEILGSVQESYPDLPELDPEALSELRTLQQIVDYIRDLNAKEEVASSSTSVSAISSQTDLMNEAAVVNFDATALTAEMLKVVADKTGYPTDMLELDMDMEADLGIDSIKRVEILGSIQESYPELPELDPEALSELRTLQQIVDYINNKVSSQQNSNLKPNIMASNIANDQDQDFDIDNLKSTMLNVVAEKTGYPIDMLELDMDMEADLGIDSIKRVEILGGVTEDFPQLPELNPEEMAELRTLEEIINYMTEQLKYFEPSVGHKEAQLTSNTTTIDKEQLKGLMLRILVEKTGYPSDMIELDMDMEADLGIDSIKRVEILGAAQDSVPNLPELDPEVMSELRTLEEIIDYIMNFSVQTTSQANKNELSNSYIQGNHTQNNDLNDALKPTLAHVALQILKSPDEYVFEISRKRCCLIVNDGTRLSIELIKKYSTLNWKVALLSFPDVTLLDSLNKIKNINCYTLENFEEKSLKDILKKIEDENGKIANLVFVDGVYKSSSAKSLDKLLGFSEKKKNHMQQLFLLAKHLAPSLQERTNKQRNALIVVTRLDGKLGYANLDPVNNSKNAIAFNAVNGASFGLLKTLKQEWPEVFCRAIDLSPSLNVKDSAQIIFSENFDVNSHLVEVGIDELNRCTLIPEEQHSATILGNSSEHKIDSESVFVVSGGAKGVTSQCVLALAKAHQSRFILLGRSPLNGIEPAWAKTCIDEASLKSAAIKQLQSDGEKPTPVKVQQLINPVISEREINSIIEKIRETGSHVSYVACDVCDTKKLKEQLKIEEKNLGTITGIIHGAGVLADKLIEDKTLEDFNSVFETKVLGLKSLISCVSEEKLQHLVLFSSAAGFFGNTAQSDYAMANDVLNKFSLSFQENHESCRVLSFNWGPWEGGMVTPQLKTMFEARGIALISLSGGVKIFVDYLTAEDNSHTQVLVGSSMEEKVNTIESSLKKKQ